MEIVHVTDGAPRSRRQWGRQEYGTRDEYAAQRHLEVRNALPVAGLDASALCRRMEVMDSEVSLNLVPVAHRLAELFDETRPAADAMEHLRLDARWDAAARREPALVLAG